MTFPFTTDEDQKIVELFKEGHSMGDIANRLRRSRSAIAGRVYRLRKKLDTGELGPRPSEPPKGRIKKVNIPSKPKLPTLDKKLLSLPKKRVRLRMIDDETTEVTFQELEKHHCRWPKGDPRQSDFRFCGAPRVSDNDRTPYCQEHTLKAGKQYS